MAVRADPAPMPHPRLRPAIAVLGSCIGISFGISFGISSAVPAPARADSTTATCSFSRHDHTIPVETGPCTFSQRQGNASVRFGERQFDFPLAEEGRSYTRSASPAGLRFNREGDYTLQVFWRSDQAALAKPPGWENQNLFLGRWQGESTAGRAVIEVLTLEPNRIRWGNAFNGVCDSDYSVEILSPRQPSEPLSGMVRLTLQPGPCATGDAVVELALPADGPSGLVVVTYGADGRLIGQYGTFTPLR